MTFPAWLDPTPITREFIGAFADAPVTLHKVWLNDPAPKPKGRPKGAKDLKPRKSAKHGPYRRK